MSRRSIVLLLTLSAFWGASYLFIKVALEDVFSAWAIVSIRTALAAAVLLPLALKLGVLDSLRGRLGLEGGEPVDRPVSPKDLLATAYHLLGIDPALMLTDRLGRPIPAAGDGVALTRAAHRFKGEAATLGATGLAELCQQLEGMDAPLDRDATMALVGRVRVEMERVQSRLEATLATPHAVPRSR